MFVSVLFLTRYLFADQVAKLFLLYGVIPGSATIVALVHYNVLHKCMRVLSYKYKAFATSC